MSLIGNLFEGLRRRAAVVEDVTVLLKAGAVLVGKFSEIAPAFEQVGQDFYSAVTDLSIDEAQKLVTDVRGAYEAFVLQYSGDGESVKAFVAALRKLVADTVG